MRTSRITVPVRKTIDEWEFHLNEKSIKFRIELHRDRDMESKSDHTPSGSFSAHVDLDALAKIGVTDFPKDSYRANSYNELQALVQQAVASYLSAGWSKVIIVALSKKNHDWHDVDAVKFTYVVAFQSTDGKMFKSDKEDSKFVTRRVQDMVRSSFENAEVTVLPWSEELESGLEKLDSAFETLVDRLHALVSQKPGDFIRIANNLPQYALLPEDTSEPA